MSKMRSVYKATKLHQGCATGVIQAFVRVCRATRVTRVTREKEKELSLRVTHVALQAPLLSRFA